jgi:hypothetical protein
MDRLMGGPLVLPAPMAPLSTMVGEPAQVTVARAAPNEVPWLQLRTGSRGQFPAQAAPTGAVLLSPPTTTGGGRPGGGNAAAQH